MSVSIYSTYEEKYEVVIPQEYGKTVSGLLKALMKLKDEGYVFRGQVDAFWPVVSSAQRAYFGYLNHAAGDAFCYRKYLTDLLNFAKQERFLLDKWLGNPKGRNYYDHEFWGWLQHFSYRTPYIDFTSDPNVALFMACRESSLPSAKEGMFSVYAIRGDYESGSNELIILEKLISDEKIRLADLADLAGVEEPDQKSFSYESWRDFSCVIVHKDGSHKPWDEDLGKARIASQSGLFMYLGRHDISLERYMSQQSKMNDGEDGEGCILEKMRCFDIPRTLAPAVLEWCGENKCTAEELGLADERIDRVLRSIYARFEEIYRCNRRCPPCPICYPLSR